MHIVQCITDETTICSLALLYTVNY